MRSRFDEQLALLNRELIEMGALCEEMCIRDRYTSGDLVINGKSTKDFSDSDWDSYRNHSIGFAASFIDEAFVPGGEKLLEPMRCV